jgi:hypothetical protein
MVRSQAVFMGLGVQPRVATSISVLVVGVVVVVVFMTLVVCRSDTSRSSPCAHLTNIPHRIGTMETVPLLSEELARRASTLDIAPSLGRLDIMVCSMFTTGETTANDGMAHIFRSGDIVIHPESGGEVGCSFAADLGSGLNGGEYG